MARSPMDPMFVEWFRDKEDAMAITRILEASLEAWNIGKSLCVREVEEPRLGHRAVYIGCITLPKQNVQDAYEAWLRNGAPEFNLSTIRLILSIVSEPHYPPDLSVVREQG